MIYMYNYIVLYVLYIYIVHLCMMCYNRVAIGKGNGGNLANATSFYIHQIRFVHCTAFLLKGPVEKPDFAIVIWSCSFANIGQIRILKNSYISTVIAFIYNTRLVTIEIHLWSRTKCLISIRYIYRISLTPILTFESNKIWGENNFHHYSIYRGPAGNKKHGWGRRIDYWNETYFHLALPMTPLCTACGYPCDSYTSKRMISLVLNSI